MRCEIPWRRRDDSLLGEVLDGANPGARDGGRSRVSVAGRDRRCGSSRDGRSLECPWSRPEQAREPSFCEDTISAQMRRPKRRVFAPGVAILEADGTVHGTTARTAKGGCTLGCGTGCAIVPTLVRGGARTRHRLRMERAMKGHCPAARTVPQTLAGHRARRAQPELWFRFAGEAEPSRPARRIGDEPPLK
jgi:hypothetical protein